MKNAVLFAAVLFSVMSFLMLFQQESAAEDIVVKIPNVPKPGYLTSSRDLVWASNWAAETGRPIGTYVAEIQESR